MTWGDEGTWGTKNVERRTKNQNDGPGNDGMNGGRRWRDEALHF
jgi:hypothetical protein